MSQKNSKNEIDSDSNGSSSRILFSEIHDLSFIELLTINYLTNINRKILRFELYKAINRLLYPMKKLSTGSFYNSLKKLAKRGFLFSETLKEKENKSSFVWLTGKGKSVVGFHQYYLMQHSIISTTIADQEIIHTITQLTTKQEFESIMVIEPDMETSPGLVTSIIPMATETLKSLGKISKRIFLLSTEILHAQYLSEGVSNINRSQILEDGVIREPNNYFDLIIFPLYGRNIDYYGKNYVEILTETKRLLTEGGHLLVVHHESIESSESHYIYSFMNQLSTSGYYYPHLRTQTRQELLDLGFNQVTEQSVMGLVLMCAQN